MSGVGWGAGMVRTGALIASLPSHDDGGTAVPRAERPPGAVGQGHVAVLHLHGGVRLAPELAHGLHDLGEAAAVGGMVVAETAAVGVEGQLAHARDEIAVGHELAPLALGAEAQ